MNNISKVPGNSFYNLSRRKKLNDFPGYKNAYVSGNINRNWQPARSNKWWIRQNWKWRHRYYDWLLAQKGLSNVDDYYKPLLIFVLHLSKFPVAGYSSYFIQSFPLWNLKVIQPESEQCHCLFLPFTINFKRPQLSIFVQL